MYVILSLFLKVLVTLALRIPTTIHIIMYNYQLQNGQIVQHFTSHGISKRRFYPTIGKWMRMCLMNMQCVFS